MRKHSHVITVRTSHTVLTHTDRRVQFYYLNVEFADNVTIENIGMDGI